MAKEYIEREELHKQVLSAYVTAERFGFELGKDVVLLAIKQQPAADVVEVVRCADCRYIQCNMRRRARTGADSENRKIRREKPC